MEKELLDRVATNHMKCSKCGFVIPFVFKKGPEYTCPSFTIVDEKPICYHCYHPIEYSSAFKKH
jgi:hypothetical protein